MDPGCNPLVPLWSSQTGQDLQQKEFSEAYEEI